jgi:hypothetical protein
MCMPSGTSLTMNPTCQKRCGSYLRSILVSNQAPPSLMVSASSQTTKASLGAASGTGNLVSTWMGFLEDTLYNLSKMSFYYQYQLDKAPTVPPGFERPNRAD